MKLYELTRGDHFVIPEIVDCPVFLFDHVDGAYSFCIVVGTGNVIHLSASADVEVVEKPDEP